MTSQQRERLQDCALLVRSAQTTLTDVGEEQIPEIEEILSCFDSADRAIRKALNG